MLSSTYDKAEDEERNCRPIKSRTQMNGETDAMMRYDMNYRCLNHAC